MDKKIFLMHHKAHKLYLKDYRLLYRDSLKNYIFIKDKNLFFFKGPNKFFAKTPKFHKLYYKDCLLIEIRFKKIIQFNFQQTKKMKSHFLERTKSPTEYYLRTSGILKWILRKKNIFSKVQTLLSPKDQKPHKLIFWRTKIIFFQRTQSLTYYFLRTFDL